MRLTEQGGIFHERCVEIREAVERAEASVAEAGHSPRGSLKVTAPLGLGRRVVAPMIATYRAQYPQIDVRLRLSDYLIDILMESVDVALRMAVMEDSSLTMRKIATIPRKLVASPAYLARRGRPRKPDDLFEHECLLLRFPGSQQTRWTFIESGATRHLPVSGAADADDGDVLTEWALLGMGIALKPEFEIAAHLESGALEPVLPKFPVVPVTLGILHPYARAMPIKIRTFSDMLAAQTRDYLEHRGMKV